MNKSILFLASTSVLTTMLACSEEKQEPLLKPRVVILTDIGRPDLEPDDTESLVHLLCYADMLEIEGIITSTGWNCDPYPTESAAYRDSVVSAYGTDVLNLMKRSGQDAFLPLEEENGRQHLGYWPSMEYLQGRCAMGSQRAGIGVIGKSTLLITEKYGSFVFLGSVITDLETETEKHEIKSCIDCGRCIASCPGGALNKYGFDSEKCISALTQKKSLTDEDEIKIKENKAAWGCDVCQKICPMNENKLTTKIGYFIGSYLENVSSETIGNMSNEEFAKYPFSWRKKDVILRNLTLAENCGK